MAGLLLQVGEEFVEFGFSTLAHAAERDGDTRGQRQLASVDEGIAGIGMAGDIAKSEECRNWGNSENNDGNDMAAARSGNHVKY